MEIYKANADSHFDLDLMPGEVMIVVSTEECRQLMMDLDTAYDTLEPASRKLWDFFVERMAL